MGNVFEELNQALDRLAELIERFERSHNRPYEMIDRSAPSLFHQLNMCFHKVWSNFDRNSASQLIQCKSLARRYLDLADNYLELLRTQRMETSAMLLDLSYEDALPHIIFEDNEADVIRFYEERLKDKLDEDGTPIYKVKVGSESTSGTVGDNHVKKNSYTLSTDKFNNKYQEIILGLWKCMEGIYPLMCEVCSYPYELIYEYTPTQPEIIRAIENELRNYTKEIGKNIERDLKKTAQRLKPSRNSTLTPEIWGLVMQEEDEIFDLAIKGELMSSKERCFEDIDEDRREQLTDNYPLLQKIKTTSLDGELFDIRLAVETHQLLSSLNADNLDLFYELVLRRNIIQREMFPDELGAKYEEWANPIEEQQAEESSETGLSAGRQSKLDEIIGILQKGDWKQPATADNVKLLLETLFGRDTSLLEDGDEAQCEKMWAFVERGGGDRSIIVPAKLAGFFRSENLIIGGPKAISDDLFGKNNNQVNAINKGKQGCSNDFDAVIPFLTKYINKIIRQV